MWTEPAKLRIGLEIFVESFLDVKKKKKASSILYSRTIQDPGLLGIKV